MARQIARILTVTAATIAIAGCTAVNSVTTQATGNAVKQSGKLKVQFDDNGMALNIYVVSTVNQTAYDNVKAIGLANGLVIDREIPAIFTIAFAGDVATARAIFQGLSGIDSQGPDGEAETTGTPNDALFTTQYAPQMVGLPDAWDVTQGSPDVIVAVIDSGVNYLHPDLAGQLVPGKDILNWKGHRSATAPDPLSSTMDAFGHGTHCAGVIAAATGNDIGIAGAASGVKVMPIKFADSNEGQMSAVAQGIVWAADNGAQILSLSVGAWGKHKQVEKAVAYAQSKGLLLIAAANNFGTYISSDSSQTSMEPATCPGVLSVGAVGPNLESDWGPFLPGMTGTFASNYGQIGLVAPGVLILSTVGTGGFTDYESWSGTSMATPLVAGVAALYKGLHPTWSAQRIKDTIERSSTSLGGSSPSNHTDQYGYGLLNARFLSTNPGCYYEGSSMYCPGDVGYN